jgi:hypothetical protein
MPTEAAVYIAKMNRADIIKEYYQRCGLETIGPNARVPVTSVETFASFEGLLDLMAAHSQWVHVVVCHGSPEAGLIMPLAGVGGHTQTGKVMSDLAGLADVAGGLAPDDPAHADRVKYVAALMGVKPEAVVRVAQKLKAFRARPGIVEIRGCNVGQDEVLLRHYRDAFGHMTSAPKCRMLYLRVQPGRPPHGKRVQELKYAKPNRPRTRRRGLMDWYHWADGALVIDVTDVDGHTNVQSTSYIEDPGDVTAWANRLLTVWRQAPAGAGGNRFVLPVMWDDAEPTFHMPLEPGYPAKLRMVA